MYNMGVMKANQELWKVVLGSSHFGVQGNVSVWKGYWTTKVNRTGSQSLNESQEAR